MSEFKFQINFQKFPLSEFQFQMKINFSYNIKMQNSDNSINWIEGAISKKHIKYYEYKHFNNIQKIDSGAFGIVYRANWKNTKNPFALKTFFNLNNVTTKEIVNEVRDK